MGRDGQRWPREIVRVCGVFNLESWNRQFPHLPVNRAEIVKGGGEGIP